MRYVFFPTRRYAETYKADAERLGWRVSSIIETTRGWSVTTNCPW